MRTRPVRVLSTVGLGLATVLLAGCGGGGSGGEESSAGRSEGGTSGSSGASGDDKALCGRPTTEWQQGLREVGAAKDEQALVAAVEDVRADTQAMADQAQDAELKAAFEGVAGELGTLASDVEAGKVDLQDPTALVRASADAVAGQADVAQACLDLGAA